MEPRVSLQYLFYTHNNEGQGLLLCFVQFDMFSSDPLYDPNILLGKNKMRQYQSLDFWC